jgi:hypothetical protein
VSRFFLRFFYEVVVLRIALREGRDFPGRAPSDVMRDRRFCCRVATVFVIAEIRNAAAEKPTKREKGLDTARWKAAQFFTSLSLRQNERDRKSLEPNCR